MKLTQEILKSNLTYDPETGIFRCIKPSRTRKSGMIAGGLNVDGYITISVENIRYYAHRLAWLYIHGSLPKHQIDHINGNRSDNRICNLRDANSACNQQNLHKAQKNNKSGFLGVTFDTRVNKWIARIYCNGKQHHIGTYDTPQKANAAYLERKRQVHVGCTI